uniref:MULE transposase domain-containing protein n=1 Tax=Acrobeloides nanus TaxID=290746 RepID=A0A914DAC1_9BILA
MNLLEDTVDWLGDGTFKSAPKPFSQVFTVHAKWRDTHRTIPCFYILLPDKSEDTYVAMFLEIRRLVNDNAPSTFSIDFEKSLINAIIRVFPAADIRGCYFHFSQNFRWHLSDYGIQDRVDNDPAIALQARMLRGLAFVPEEDVVNTYELLLQNIDIPTWHDFLSNYFEIYYIGEPHRYEPGRDDGVFARATWNVHQRTLN